MDRWLHFRCPGCNARIRANEKLLGKTRACPGCGHRLVVQPDVPPEQAPLLVPANTSASGSPAPRE